MTPKEALAIVWNPNPKEATYEETVEAYHALQDIVRKRTASLVRYEKRWFYCPSCNQLLGGTIMKYHQYCFKCGQALKWMDRIE